MREHERNIAELITYDDMESVTKQLEEEHERNMEVSGLTFACKLVNTYIYIHTYIHICVYT